MDKVRLEIAGLSYSQTQSGAYALVLAEVGGRRSLPIIIGGYEAQAIAIELEKMTPNRPLTHDLFKRFTDAFGVEVKEIIINDLIEGVFYAKVVCEKEGAETIIDARTSDAIALGVRYKCPIYTYETILSSAGILLDENNELQADADEELFTAPQQDSLNGFTTEELQEQLQAALEDEDYEKASKIRDEIARRTK